MYDDRIQAPTLPCGILAPLAIWILTVLFSIILHYIVALKIQNAITTIFAVAIAVVALSGLLLLGILWACFCEHHCSLVLKISIYLIYPLIVLALGISALVLKNSISQSVNDYFESHDDISRVQFANALNCSWPANATENNECINKFKDLSVPFANGIGIALIVIFGVMLIIGCLPRICICELCEEKVTLVPDGRMLYDPW
jgi:hypothetical protein